MSTITDALNEAEPFRTAGALPSTRTFGMVENALESDDIDVVKAELVHTRAHYQSLEYILNDEENILTSLRTSIAEGEYPTPTTPDEAEAPRAAGQGVESAQPPGDVGAPAHREGVDGARGRRGAPQAGDRRGDRPVGGGGPDSRTGGATCADRR